MIEKTPTDSHDLAALRSAADAARAAGDHAAAIAHYGAALALLADQPAADPHAEYELRLSRAACYHASGDATAGAGDLAAMAGLAASLSGPDLRALLASQATTALENARLYEDSLRANRELERWLAERTANLEQRNAELAIINSVQQGLAAQLDLQAIFDLVGDKIREIFDAQEVDIGIYDRATGLVHYPYWIERGVRYPSDPTPLFGFRKHVIETRQMLLLNSDLDHARTLYDNQTIWGEAPKSMLFVPLVVGDEAKGYISLQNFDHEHAFSDSDVRLLSTLAASMSVALENARLFEETRRLLAETEQRNAELAIINSVQQALAAQLDLPAIFDLVGDKIRDIFDAHVVGIGIYDAATDSITDAYAVERGARLRQWEPYPLFGFRRHIVETRQPLLINEHYARAAEQYGNPVVLRGEAPRSVLFVPLVVGEQARGYITLQDLDREHAFSDSDVRLLSTLAASMSVAIENARLFEQTRVLLAETELRNSELAAINTIQQRLAAQLDTEAIVELVGQQISQIFDADVVYIALHDQQAGLIRFPYYIEAGEREHPEPIVLGKGLTSIVVQSRRPLLLDTFEQQHARGVLTDDRPAESWLGVPILLGDATLGAVSVQSYRPHVYHEHDAGLLSTLAASMGVALENARLFEETRRLLAEAEQHNAELAGANARLEQRSTELTLINSVQQALAAQLDLQAIFDLVGDKIRDIFDAQVVVIGLYNPATDLLSNVYAVERGVRMHEWEQQSAFPPFGFRRHILESRQPLLINDAYPQACEQYGNPLAVDGEVPRSVLFMPLIIGEQARGYISLQDLDHEHAFTESGVRLLSTLAAGLSVAIENARLFDESRRLLAETEQRAAELAIINNVQEGLAALIDMQAMHELVGDKIRDLFEAQVVNISIYDRATNLLRFSYLMERGVRDQIAPIPLVGFRKHVIQTRQTLVINADMERRAAEYGNPLVLSGEAPKSALFVPLAAADEAFGVISVQNLDREQAFSEADVRLLSTFGASLSVALENARLFEATKRLLAEAEQHNAELETVNRIGQALGAELELDALIELTGEQIRQIFAADIAYVALRDREADVIQFPYYYEHGTHTFGETMPYGPGLTSRIIASGEPLLLNQRIEQFEAETGIQQVGTRAKSYLGVPIMSGARPIGVISAQSTQAEGRFGDDDMRLLATIAANVGAAIQNARLFQETRQRAEEMAALAEIGRDISATLDLPTALERIAAHAKELLHGRDVVLRLLEPDGRLPAVVALGKYAEVYKQWQVQLGYGLTGHIAQSGVAEIVNDPPDDPRVAHIPGTEADDPTEAMIQAPLLIGEKVIGVMTVWRDKTVGGPFNQADLDFSVGLARQAAIAIENARLFAEIRRQKQFSDALIEASPVAIIQEDLDEFVTSWNPAAQALFGYTREEALGRHIDDLVANRPDVRQDADRYTRATSLAQGGVAHHGFGRRTRKDGQLVDVEFFGVGVTVDGQEVAGINLYHDITELQKARREAIAANEAKSAFLANMSHELRTPLNAVLGFAQLMERDPSLAPRQKEHLGIITRSGEHLLSLINDVLEMSKIEAGQVTLNEAPFDLHALLRSVEELFRLRAESKQLRLRFDLAPGLPQYVSGDESKLRQILINLLGNAVKFTSAGGVTVRAAWSDDRPPTTDHQSLTTSDVARPSVVGPPALSLPKGQSSLVAEVEDTGVGIAADQLPDLFQPFVQTASGVQAHEGTGLGLAITRQFVRLMGGEITVASTPGQGSVFSFDARLARIDRVPAPQLMQRRVVGVAGGGPPYRMLVVDDKWENRRLLVEWLSAAGFEVREAANGQEAIAEWERWEPHLIWMDMRMPVLDGYAATRQIRSTLKGQATVIIALTASAFEHEQAIVLSAGCDDFVRKPVREALVFEKIAQHLGVEFVYAEQIAMSEISDAGTTLRSTLEALPPEWLASLKQAVLTADMEQIKILARQINTHDQALADRLERLASDLRLDQLYVLIQA